ncbi:hypothetical protein DRN94_002890 [archaeon]|nr:hypothetical protein [archaeon]
MFRFLVREVAASSVVRWESLDRVPATVKIIGVVAVVGIAVWARSPLTLLALLSYPLITAFIARDLEAYLHALKAPLLPVLAIGGLSLLFSRLTIADVVAAVAVMLRIYALATTLLVFIATTHPLQLARFLERFHAPCWLLLSTILTWRLIPHTLRAADEAYAVARLKGDPLWRGLVATASTTLLRANSQVEALYIYGTGLSRLTLQPIVPSANRRNTLLHVIAVACSIVVCVLLEVFITPTVFQL